MDTMLNHRIEKASTGISGLDEILCGGLPAGRVYLVHGKPGSGKTTLGFQFLHEGVRSGERCLYVTLLQSRSELEEILASHGWSLEGIEVVQLPEEVRDVSLSVQTVFAAGEVELNEITDVILAAVDRYRPARVVLDSVSELAVLVDDSYQLRTQLLRIKRKLSESRSTAILIAGEGSARHFGSLETIVHGAIGLERHTTLHSGIHRRLEVSKVRGMVFVEGKHDFLIKTGGIFVYRRTLPTSPRTTGGQEIALSELGSLDELLGGGLDYGTSCLVTGTAGAGKSTLATHYVCAAARRGHHSSIYCFDERIETFLKRSEGLKMPARRFFEEGAVALSEVSLGELPSAVS